MAGLHPQPRRSVQGDLPWHYQDIDVCQAFDGHANCPDGTCITAQIERMGRRLGDRRLPVKDRIEALAFLVHFTGDLHMPLHVGEHDDHGGNAIPADYGAISYPRLSLHWVWDSYLAERAISAPPGGARARPDDHARRAPGVAARQRDRLGA